MSDTDHLRPSDAPHPPCGDAAAYALGALEPDETEAFRSHLADCSVCREELASFQSVAEALPTAVEQYPAPRGAPSACVRPGPIRGERTRCAGRIGRRAPGGERTAMGVACARRGAPSALSPWCSSRLS